MKPSEKYTFRSLHRALFVTAIVLSFLAFYSSAHGEKIDNTSESCADVLLVFARGSSSNNDDLYLDEPFKEKFAGVEPEAGTFFQKFKSLLDQDYPHVTYKAVSVHDFPNKYHPKGYRAVHATAPAPRYIDLNTLNAEWGIFPGDYRDSVSGGVREVAGFVSDETARCPDQRIVMGGYSQGAEVIGDGLFELSEDERENIAGVALFGDPKFLAAKDAGIIDGLLRRKAKPYPWKRGTAGDKDTGFLDPRDPYVPDDLIYKTFSWCFDDDFICSGGSGFRLKISAGHTRYANYGIPQAADEIFQRMAPEFYVLEKSRGGVSRETPAELQPQPLTPNAKPIDIMYLVDTSAGMDDVLGNLRSYTDNILTAATGFMSNVRFGLADTNEQSYGGNVYYPRYSFYQDLGGYLPPANPMDSSGLVVNFHRNLAWGQRSGGGADRANPHGLAVEKTVRRAGWRPEAVKHVILFTDRPAKDPYTYNICNGVLNTNIGLPRLACTDAPGATALDTRLYPELCDTAWQIITLSQCALPVPAPGPVHDITRRLADAINVARSQGVAVSVVVPHAVQPPQLPSDKLDVEQQLEYFAKATGGLYLKYDQFRRPEYSDVMWRVLNHQPKQIALAYKDALEVLGPNQVLGASDAITARTNVPVVFDASGSNLTADSYEWDFDGDGAWDQRTSGPNTEHTFAEASTGQFVGVTAFDAGQAIASISLPLTVEPYDGPLPDMSVPELPENISAKQLTNGDVALAWQGGQPDTIIVIKDPDSGLPIVSLPVEQGSITIPNAYISGDTLLILAAGENANSNPRTLEIEQLPIAIGNPDQLLSIKLFGLSPGETVAGNEILNPEAAAIQATFTPTVQDTAVVNNPNVLAQNTVSASKETLSYDSNPAPATINQAALTPELDSNSNYLLIILVVVASGVIAGAWLIVKKIRS